MSSVNSVRKLLVLSFRKKNKEIKNLKNREKSGPEPYTYYSTQIANQNHGEGKTIIWKCATILQNKMLSLKSSPLKKDSQWKAL